MKTAAELPVRILTHNIRYATSRPFKGEKPWTDRKPLLLNELYFNTLYNAEAFICLQEVLHNQLVDIMTGLNAMGEWAYIGVGRDDGKEAGEYSPIIYRPSVWRLDGWKTVWLSETPEKPSKGWDAASTRIVTIGRFTHHESKKQAVGMSTHLDDQGEKSRTESAKLILEEVEKASSLHDSHATAVFLAGDLNSEPEGSAYQILTAKQSSLEDVDALAKVKYANRNTFTGWLDSTPKTEIDHVFVGPKGMGTWSVRAYSVLENKFEDGVYNSDHRAVVGDVVLTV